MLLHSRAILRAAINRVRTLAGAEPLDDKVSLRTALKQSGQVVVIFALMLTVLIGMVGIAIDTTYAWREALRVQRAADSAALAGVVYMPGDFTTAQTIAWSASTKNGFPDGGLNDVNPTAATNPRELDVTITTQVPTFFSRIFGINSWAVTRTGKAVYVMPVAMGSPLAYYGVGCFILTETSLQPTKPSCNTTGTGDSGLTSSGIGLGGLGSLGSWGAISSKGGDEMNGDAYATQNDSTGSGTNVNYKPAGYDYTVTLPSGGGIKIFDPGFCSMGTNPSGVGSLGAGDHWVDNNTGSGHAMSTYYTLWDTHNQPINSAAWTIYPGTYTGSTFENNYGYDSNELGSSSAPAGATAGQGGCNATYHDKWWSWVGSLPAGTYEVQVQTTNPGNSSINAGTNAQNMFSLEATGTGAAVFGQSSMCVYNNLANPSGTSAQKFYLGKVDQTTGAGKTLAIDLFDIGDVSHNGTLKIWSPNGAGGTQVTAQFNFTTSSMWGVIAGGGVGPQSGVGVTSIATMATGSHSNYDNTWIHILIPLGTSYGSSGLWQGGWWQIEYDISGGGASDLTTWAVNVIGNPVHLIN